MGRSAIDCAAPDLAPRRSVQPFYVEVEKPLVPLISGRSWRWHLRPVDYMSKLTYHSEWSEAEKPLVWLRREVKTPPLSSNARIKLGYRLRLLQRGVVLEMPHSRPLRLLGKSCYELRVRDAGVNWRLVYRIDEDAIVIAGLFKKTSRTATDRLIETSGERLALYDAAVKG